MGNTYTQIHIQVIFAVKYRKALLDPAWSGDLHAYITGIVQNNKHKMLQINSMPDHLHFLMGLRPNQAISDLVQNVKTETSKWINRNGILQEKFAWQGGFGAFSYSKNDVQRVIRYIQNQQAHHKKETFISEYKRILSEFELDFDENYIFTNPL